MNPTEKETQAEGQLSELVSKYKTMTKPELAEAAVDMAYRQVMACSDFKKPRLKQISKYYELYDGKVQKKLRQLFNVPIPVFAGMIDTLNAQYDAAISLKFEPGDAADYFKTEKINGAWRMEVMNTAQNSKWDSKLRMGRKHAIMTGRMIAEYNVTSDPKYTSELSNVLLKDFNFQPRGGLYLENHLFAGTEDIEKTRSDLVEGALAGIYDKKQVNELISRGSQSDYLQEKHGAENMVRNERFKPLGLDADNNSFVGQEVYKLCQHILEIDGKRYVVVFDMWTKVWIRFERWNEVDESDLLPYTSYATHEDSENFMSKSYGDDLYLTSDAIVAMFNQELTNREKRNFGARAYDKDMFTDVRKLDESMHRPDALVPADTKGGTRRISEGIYEFKVGELGGTVNLIDWMTSSLGRNTGATDLAMGGTQDATKKASVTFAEQKSVSKRLGWGAQPFQDMIAELGQRFIWGLKNHMPATMAVKIMGEGGYDWDEITRLDLDTKKDLQVLIRSTDEQQSDSEMKSKRRAEALNMVDINTVNPQWRNEQILKSVGEFEDDEIAQAQDMKTYHDRKSLSKASEAIQLILQGDVPDVWGGATVAFMQKIVDFANDKRSTLKDDYKLLIDYAMSHKEVVTENIDREISEQQLMSQKQAMARGGLPEGQAGAGAPSAPGPNVPTQPPESTAANPGMTGGASRAMSIAENAV